MPGPEEDLDNAEEHSENSESEREAAVADAQAAHDKGGDIQKEADEIIDQNQE